MNLEASIPGHVNNATPHTIKHSKHYLEKSDYKKQKGKGSLFCSELFAKVVVGCFDVFD
jgi:hypothetical protein